MKVSVEMGNYFYYSCDHHIMQNNSSSEQSEKLVFKPILTHILLLVYYYTKWIGRVNWSYMADHVRGLVSKETEVLHRWESVTG